MRRILTQVSCRRGVCRWASSFSSSFDDDPSKRSNEGSTQGTNAFSPEKGAGDEAHPLLYNVPVMSSRTVGRDAEVLDLWQNTLAGKRIQVLAGVDGVGKSTLAAEFCDCVRRSNRFTCIQWLNSQYSPVFQLRDFFASMKGRNEKEVLFVLDDVDRPDEILAKLPRHEHVHVLLTSSSLDNVADRLPADAHVTQVAALKPEASMKMVPECSEGTAAVFATLGYVPLLVHVAAALLERGVASAAELLQTLQAKEVMRENTLSVSGALDVLLSVSLGEMEKHFPACREHLAILSCYHTAGLSDAVIAAVVGDEDTGSFCQLASEVGIFSLKWEDTGFSIHSTVAALLRKDKVDARLLTRAAEILLSLWPRRWRGSGSQAASDLVWHSNALATTCVRAGLRPPPALCACLDRSAGFLALVEGRNLELAAELWCLALDAHHASKSGASADSVRMGRECGKLLYHLQDGRCQMVLQRAWEESCVVYGKGSSQSALILGFLAPFLAPSHEVVADIESGIVALENSLQPAESALTEEETRMILETLSVLWLVKGQMLRELNCTVPQTVHDALSSLRSRLEKLEATGKRPPRHQRRRPQ